MKYWTFCASWVVLSASVLGQVAGPTQDPAAMALIDAADKVVYSPLRAGLQDLQYRHRFQKLPGIEVAVKWLAPDQKKLEVAVAGDAAAHVKQMAEAVKSQLLRQAELTLEMVVGKDSRKTYGGDKVELLAPRQVKITAMSERSKTIFKESTITFDEVGRPSKMVSTTESGTISMNVTFQAKGEQWIVKEVASETGSGPMSLTIEYQESGTYLFPSRLTNKTGTETIIQEFADMKVDSGMTADALK